MSIDNNLPITIWDKGFGQPTFGFINDRDWALGSRQGVIDSNPYSITYSDSNGCQATMNGLKPEEVSVLKINHGY